VKKKNLLSQILPLPGRFREAVRLFREVATPPEFIDFLTLPAYGRVASVAI
jgi:hypothetical protein